MALNSANPLNNSSGLVSDKRQNSQETPTNQNFFPDQAFEFDNPNDIRGDNEEIELKMKDGWKFYVEGIELDQLDVNDRILIEDAIIRSKDNELQIINNAGGIQLNGDEIELRVKGVGPNGERVRDAVIKLGSNDSGSFVYVDASSIYLGDLDGDPATLDGVITVDGSDVIIGDYNNVLGNGEVGIKWEQDTGVLDIKGALNGVSGTFSGDLIVSGDSSNRDIEIGSEGIKAGDSSGNTIHDLPNAPTPNLNYLGHLYLNPFNSVISLTDTYQFSTSSTNTSGSSGYKRMDLSGFLGGSTNIKAVLLNIYVTGFAGLGKCTTQSIIGGSMAFYSDISGTIFHGFVSQNSPVTTGSATVSHQRTQTMLSYIVPFATDVPNSIVYKLSTNGSFMTTSNLIISSSVSVRVVGFYA